MSQEIATFARAAGARRVACSRFRYTSRHRVNRVKKLARATDARFLAKWMSRSPLAARARKRPRQERSAEMVDAILVAATRLFVELGYDSATTNRIAAAAGVSVGSLYQYFSSKSAIAVEILRRYRKSRLELVSSGLSRVGGAPLEGIVRALMEALIHAERLDPSLYRVLIERVARSEARQELKGYEERLEAIVADALRAAVPPGHMPHVELSAFVIVRAVLGVVLAAIADKPQHDTPELVEELTQLVVRYIAPPGA
jgi:AcrR family transcriptional regulator